MLFGDFIRSKRLRISMESKELAKQLGIHPSYMVDFEKGRRRPPDEKGLNILAEALKLSTDEKYIMFDLAAKARNNVSYDISEYVIDKKMARVALRTAKEKKLGEDFWAKVNQMAIEEEDR